MKTCNTIAACATSLLMCNCATIFGGASNRDVLVRSNPEGAKVTVTDKKGQLVHQGVTPTTVSLRRSSGFFVPASYKLNFKKKGCPDQTVDLKAEINPWYFGNIVFGGLIGILIVDPATGAMWTLDKEYAAELGSGVASNQGSDMRIVERSQMPAKWEKHLVSLSDQTR